MLVPCIIALVFVLSQASEETQVTDYLRSRENLINKEKSEFFGANLKLSKDEVIANKYLMSAKLKDFDEGLSNFQNSSFTHVMTNILMINSRIQKCIKILAIKKLCGRSS